MANYNALLTPGANPGGALINGLQAAQEQGMNAQRMNLLAQQETRAQADQQRQNSLYQRQITQQDETKQHQMEIAAASAMAYSPQPKRDAERFYPEYVAQLKQSGQWDAVTDDQVRQQAMQELRFAEAQAGQTQERISLEDQFKADQALKLKQAELTAAEKSRQQQQAFTAAENEKNRAVQTRGQDLTAQAAASRSNTTTAQSQAQNQRTLETYETAMAGLKQAMAATETGPLAGRIPAFTTEQQTAEGAVSAMAPILKQIFRVAGEGTFTDNDQELLLQMVPTRKDTPEARAAKIQNIDNIVKSKLGVTKTAGATGGWTVRKVQ